MRKNVINIFLLISIFFFNINIVFAAENENTHCDEINKKIQDYNSYTEQLKNINCEDNTNSSNVALCNDFNIKKNIVVTELMKLNDNDDICESYQSQVDKIIEENEDRCGQIFDDTFKDFVNTGMTIFYILGPILLIFFGTLDFAKATVSSEEEALRKAGKNFAKRVAATVLLFATPTIVNLIISLNVSDKYLSGNAYTCDYKYAVYRKKYNIIYVPKTNSSTNSSNVQTVFGGITTDAQADELEKQLTALLKTVIHKGNGKSQNGPFPKYWSKNGGYNRLSPFQCTWWANGRASQYLEQTIHKQYPTQQGNGGDYYEKNKNDGYFGYGQVPKPNSIISWTKNGQYGHVAYVEGVTSDGIYISHAGSGKSWYGIDKISLDGDLSSIGWKNYKLNGYIYLSEPNNPEEW